MNSCENCAYRWLIGDGGPCAGCSHNYVDRFVPATCANCIHKNICKYLDIKKCNGNFMPMGNWVWEESDDDD